MFDMSLGHTAHALRFSSTTAFSQTMVLFQLELSERLADAYVNEQSAFSSSTKICYVGDIVKHMMTIFILQCLQCLTYIVSQDIVHHLSSPSNFQCDKTAASPL
jgi:hypothetical protein